MAIVTGDPGPDNLFVVDPANDVSGDFDVLLAPGLFEGGDDHITAEATESENKIAGDARRTTVSGQSSLTVRGGRDQLQSTASGGFFESFIAGDIDVVEALDGSILTISGGQDSDQSSDNKGRPFCGIGKPHCWGCEAG
jgi:hypothetical protein